MNTLPSTEAVCIDLVALRNWHFQASIDIDRQPEMRRWHRRQADIIGRKLAQQRGEKMPLAKIMMIEFLASWHRELVLHKAMHSKPWDWDKACAEARKEVERRAGK